MTVDENGLRAAIDVLWPTQEWNGEERVCEAVARAAITAYLSARSAEPVAWRIRIGDSDSWGYTDTESDADFWLKQSGRSGVKQPLYAAPTPSSDPQRTG